MDLSTDSPFAPTSPLFIPRQFMVPSTISPSGAAGNQERPHKCLEPGCYQQFKRKFTLTEHMKTHTGEQPFVCPVKSCGKTFVTSGNLSRHKRLHPWLRPEVCLVAGCGRSFVNEAKLERHLATHFKSPRANTATQKREKREMEAWKQEHDDCMGRERSIRTDGSHHESDPRSTNPASYEPIEGGDSAVSDADLLEFLECLF